jgi:hypothetical protein
VNFFKRHEKLAKATLTFCDLYDAYPYCRVQQDSDGNGDKIFSADMAALLQKETGTALTVEEDCEIMEWS